VNKPQRRKDMDGMRIVGWIRGQGQTWSQGYKREAGPKASSFKETLVFFEKNRKGTN
jgi:hypothetical protein